MRDKPRPRRQDIWISPRITLSNDCFFVRTIPPSVYVCPAVKPNHFFFFFLTVGLLYYVRAKEDYKIQRLLPASSTVVVKMLYFVILVVYPSAKAAKPPWMANSSVRDRVKGTGSWNSMSRKNNNNISLWK